MIHSKTFLLVGLVLLICLAQPTHAFGAGNIASISKIEGINWRHGDIEDVLFNIMMARAMKGKKFTKMMVSRVYFGNWLRDYSQAVDVGTVKTVTPEAIRLVLCVLAFLSFGYGSKEFEVTTERLGCYRPEEHIDNPRNYADNEDARKYDRRLRGPVDERRELSVDPETGMKNYIANEKAGIMTSAQLLRDLFGQSIDLGRRYARSKKDDDLYEALRLMGTGLHCLEDFFAHSNYIELALIEMGERDVFPHVGRDTMIRLQGARGNVYPLVTGTFGGVDFLHSVTGEVSDKLKQNEIDELESTLQANKNNDTSVLRNLLDMIPDGIFGGKHQSDRIDEIQQSCNNSQMQNMSVSPKEPAEFTRYVQGIFKQIMPLIEWHDDIMQSISEKFEKIPVLPKILEQLEEQLTRFVFANLAPFVLPVIHQIQREMQTGSEHLIESSERDQHIVFEDHRSTDPTHSMLSKDHFTNLLNEPGGRAASDMVAWVVPQIMDAMDDERIDIQGTISRIIYGVFHHPAQRGMGDEVMLKGRRIIFGSIEKWWTGMSRQQQDDYRRKLSREGVRRHENHKEGEYDTGHGHGCIGKLEMHKQFGGGGVPDTWEDKVADKAAGALFKGASGAISGMIQQTTGVKLTNPSSSSSSERPAKQESSSSSGGLLGAASSLLGGVFKKEDSESSSSGRRDNDSSYTESRTDYGQSGSGYGQTQYNQTQQSSGYGSSSGGGRRDNSSSGYGGSSGSGRRDNSSSGGYGGGGTSGSSGRQGDSSYGRSSGRREDSSYGSQQSGGYGSQQSSGYGSQQSGGGYGSQQSSSGYGSQQSQQSGGYGGRQSGGYGSQQSSGYGSQQSGGGYGGQQSSSSGYGSQQSGGYGSQQSGGGYGSSQSNRRDDNRYGSSGGGNSSYGSSGQGGRQDQGYGGRQGQGGRRDDRDQYGSSGRRY